MPLPGMPEDFLLKGLGLHWLLLLAQVPSRTLQGMGPSSCVQLGRVSLSSLAFLPGISPVAHVPWMQAYTDEGAEGLCVCIPRATDSRQHRLYHLLPPQ